MRQYQIAFFTADWNYELVETTLHGLKQYVEDHDNVRVRIFDCFGKDLGNARDRSEYAIFDLADLSQFDGVLVQSNQIILKSVREAIARRIVQTGIPAVTLDCPLEGCTLLAIDNRQSQRDITDHVVRVHGARRLVYLTGLLDNGSPEGRQRMEGFLDVCHANGIPDEDIEIVECTWRTSDGFNLGRRWMRQKLPLPDAFVCANDDMALGLIEGLSEGGCRIPADTIVTGFDGLSSAELSSPRLSTVQRDNKALIYRAMELLIGKIDGVETPAAVPFESKIICSESCGCEEASPPEYIRSKYFHQTRFLKEFYALQDRMAEELFNSSDLVELMEIVEKNRSIFGCDNVYLCANDYYFDNYDKKSWHHGAGAFGKEMVLAPCGRPSGDAGERPRYIRYPTRELLPRDMIQDANFLIFYPLHYNAYSIGYLAMDGISEAARMNLHISIFNFLEIAIDNVRKKGLLQQLNDVLDNLYVHDALTGLYNRFGYDRFGQQTYNGFLAESGHAQVLFVDMDDMKGINDRYGHETGDDAIQATAQVLQRACAPGDFLMRYGGDEFLVISACPDDSLTRAIQETARRHDYDAKLPCPLSLSIGAIYVNSEQKRTLSDCIRQADTLMYEHKSRRKTAAGGNA